jgi:hypothetical protein
MGKFVGLGAFMDTFNLERDLLNSDTIRTLVQTDAVFAQELYAALCNNQFVHVRMNHPEDEYWSCTWRYAGGVVAALGAAGGDYLDYYCSGNEGVISSRVAAVLSDIGWSSQPWPNDN